MKFSLLFFFFILFIINNLLHQISEKIVIVIFVIFLTILIKLFSSILEQNFSTKIKDILNDINMYVNSLMNFLFLNKVLFINTKNFIQSVFSIFNFINKRVLSIIRLDYYLH